MPDAFDALGLEPRFDLARDTIERRYLERVAVLHPDASGAEPDLAARTADLNDARAVLLNPEHRAAALLLRIGGASAAKDKSLPPAFLAEIMEVREEIDAARSSGNPADLERWRSWARDRRAAIIDEVAGAFSALPSPPAPAPLSAIRRTLNAWRYIERLVEQLEDPAR